MRSLSALVDLTQSGDTKAKVELFDRLRSYVRALAGSPECVPAGAQREIDASDLTQAVMLRLLKALDHYRGSTNQELQAWIKTIVHNQAIDTLRRPTLAALDLTDAPAECNGQPIADDTTPSAKLIRSERILQLAAALEELPDDQRNAIRWRYLDELPIEEIARRLGGRSTGAVAQLIRRGICGLNEILSRDE